MNIRQVALVLIVTAAFAANAWAVPAAPVTTEVSQPDGTSFIVRARGDEYANWIETLDGHSVVKVGDTWYYAESDNAGGLRASSMRVGSLSPVELQSIPLHLSPAPDPEAFEPVTVRKIPRGTGNGTAKQAPGLGVSHTQRVLTLLVNYSGLGFTYSDASFQTLMYGANNSVKDFFLDNSYTGFTVTPANETYGTANDGIIHVTQPKAHPNQGGSIATSRTEAREIVALANSYIDFASFDTNGNGTVSVDELSIVIILAGYETSYGATPLTPNVWGHKSSFTTLALDGVNLSPYTMFGEAHATSAGNKHQATIGIMCHELGHLMLGLPDLYDTSAANGDSEGIGEWGLMGGGSWTYTAGNYSGNSPAHMSAWSKVATNFTIPQEIDINQNGVSFPKADTSEAARRIWIDKYKWNESFLVENRQKSGYDAGLPGSGLLIWHIDDRLRTNSDETHKWVDLEEADGLLHLDNEVNRGDAGDPFPGTSNKTVFNDSSNPNSKDYAGAATQIGVTGISASSATMTANIAAFAGGTGDHIRYDENGVSNAAWYNNNQNTAWVGIRAQNDTINTNFDGVDVYVWPGTTATIDIYFYTGMSGGAPTGLIHSQAGFAATEGWNRLLLNTPQSFPAGSERGIVLKVVNSSNYTIVYDGTGVPSGRSYYNHSGSGTFALLNGDLDIVALLGGSDTTNPTATAITPATTGPTNADSVSFNVTFSEDVVNFNNANDVTLTHSGTSHSGVTVTGSGSAYTVDVTGISGNGSFTLKARTGSDIQDSSGNPLSASVTSLPVHIDNEAPSLFIAAPSSDLTNTGPVSFVVNYGGANAVSLANGNITLNKTGTANGSVNVTGEGTSSRLVTISGITGDGSLGISIAAGTASDEAGNSALAAGPGTTFTVDNTAPGIIELVPYVMGPTNQSTVSIGIVTSEDVFNFNNSNDVTITHSGTSHIGVTITGAGSDYQADVSDITGTGSFTLKGNTGSDVRDAAGNPLATGITSGPIFIDNLAPEISIGAPSPSQTTNGPVSFTITYSGADSVSLANGHITLNKTGTANGDVDVTGSGNSSRTVTISNISGSGTLGISIAAGSAFDNAGNTAGAAGPGATVLVAIVEEIFEDSFESPPD